jgi:uncharacterized damage-inducible protein DinB
LTLERLAAPLVYKTTAGERCEHPLWWAVTHFFNHQTHHRGQAHALVTMAAGNVAMPSLDLIMFQRETGIGLA